jgi:hypothetical protein
MDAYYAEVHKLEKHFQGLEFHHVIRDLNIAADVLAKLGSHRATVQRSSVNQSSLYPSLY